HRLYEPALERLAPVVRYRAMLALGLDHLEERLGRGGKIFISMGCECHAESVDARPGGDAVPGSAQSPPKAAATRCSGRGSAFRAAAWRDSRAEERVLNRPPS